MLPFRTAAGHERKDKSQKGCDFKRMFHIADIVILELIRHHIEHKLDTSRKLAQRVLDAVTADRRRNGIVADGVKPVMVSLPDGTLVVVFLRDQRKAVEFIDLFCFHNRVERTRALIIK